MNELIQIISLFCKDITYTFNHLVFRQTTDIFAQLGIVQRCQ